jgi:signal transduction histidine kinase
VVGLVIITLVRLFTRIPHTTFTPIFGVFLLSGFLMPIALALRTIKIKRRRSLIFLSAFTVYLIVIFFLAVMGFMGITVINSLYLSRSAFIWLLLVFTITANDRIGSLRREREESQTLLLQEQIEALRVQTELTEEISKAREELEERVQERTKELRQINEELEAFSYSVSHDLRAPLRAMQGFSEVLVEDYGGKMDLEAQGYLERIINSTQRMDELIEDLLNLSKVSRETIERSTVNLSDLVVEILSEFEQLNPGIDTSFSITPNLVSNFDRRMIRIALKNLLENAWKFSVPKGMVEIEFGKTEQDGCVVYFIQDKGVGFDPEKSEKIFNVFQRCHPDIPGTGIGLAIVKRIINKHGGKVWAETKPEHGSSFYFSC